MIAANRSLLATLVATNFLGINTPAIAATEAQYAEMWVQDAVTLTSLRGRLDGRWDPSADAPGPETTNPAARASNRRSLPGRGDPNPAAVGFCSLWS